MAAKVVPMRPRRRDEDRRRDFMFVWCRKVMEGTGLNQLLKELMWMEEETL